MSSDELRRLARHGRTRVRGYLSGGRLSSPSGKSVKRCIARVTGQPSVPGTAAVRLRCRVGVHVRTATLYTCSVPSFDCSCTYDISRSRTLFSPGPVSPPPRAWPDILAWRHQLFVARDRPGLTRAASRRQRIDAARSQTGRQLRDKLESKSDGRSSAGKRLFYLGSAVFCLLLPSSSPRPCHSVCYGTTVASSPLV